MDNMHNQVAQVIDWVEYHQFTKPDAPALIDLEGGRRFSYAELHQRAGRVAGMLEARDIGPGDVVAFLCLNTTDVMEFIVGCWRVGAICLAMNYRLAPPELAYILNDSGTKLVLVDEPFRPLAAAAVAQAGTVDHVIHTQGMGGESEYEAALAEATPRLSMHPQGYADQCLLMYSSGTTGRPKGVIITHGMIEFTNNGTARVMEGGPDRVSLNNMPLFHIGGLQVTALPTLWVGGCCVVMRMFDINRTLEAISDPELNIDTLFMVPAAFNAMRVHPNLESFDFSRIKVALSGGETVPEPLSHFWLSKGLTILEGYGMTETCAAGTMLRPSDIPERIGSSGRPLSHSRIKIVDENGSEVPRGEAGEIWFKGASVTPGYWRNPEANAASFTDGWFHSGDIGRMDTDGYVYIEDRVKDMYISGGENVYPAEVEGLLYEMPAFAELAVIGVPDDRWGETGCVVGVLKEGESVDIAAVQAHLSGRLAKYKIPNHLHITDAIPRGGSGKVLKFELRKSVPEALGL